LTRTGRQTRPNDLRQQLIDLLTNFEDELRSGSLRTKVQALVPVHRLLDSLGISLIPRDLAASARDRILHYLKSYSQQIIPGEELMVVAGISEWARRVRELRVQFGWKIVSGITAVEMNAEGELDIPGGLQGKPGPDDYILLNLTQDKEAAFRWNIANQIRRQKDLSVQGKILEFLRQNVGTPISGEELRYVAGNRTEWARRVRELRTELGWPVVTRYTGNPEMDVGVYVLEAERQAPAHDRKIPTAVMREVLNRDKNACTECGWTQTEWNRTDPRYLELHHKEHHVKGGKNEADNLITLCNKCHDEIHKTEKKQKKSKGE
jgi:hypothetical protein